MDTDNLSVETYQAVIIESEKFNHNLTIQFGIIASECQDEEEYLEKAVSLIEKIKQYDITELEEVLFLANLNVNELHSVLDKICINIENVKKISEENRTYDF